MQPDTADTLCLGTPGRAGMPASTAPTAACKGAPQQDCRGEVQVRRPRGQLQQVAARHVLHQAIEGRQRGLVQAVLPCALLCTTGCLSMAPVPQPASWCQACAVPMLWVPAHSRREQGSGLSKELGLLVVYDAMLVGAALPWCIAVELRLRLREQCKSLQLCRQQSLLSTVSRQQHGSNGGVQTRLELCQGRTKASVSAWELEVREVMLWASRRLCAGVGLSLSLSPSSWVCRSLHSPLDEVRLVHARSEAQALGVQGLMRLGLGLLPSLPPSLRLPQPAHMPDQRAVCLASACSTLLLKGEATCSLGWGCGSPCPPSPVSATACTCAGSASCVPAKCMQHVEQGEA